jgi:hypothetical protein
MKTLGAAYLVLITVLGGSQSAFGQQEQPATRSPATPTSLPDLTPDAKGNLSQEQMQQLFRVAAD